MGWEYEAAGRLAGLRTYMLVCLSAMLFVRLGILLIAEAVARFPPGALRADPAPPLKRLQWESRLSVRAPSFVIVAAPGCKARLPPLDSWLQRPSASQSRSIATLSHAALRPVVSSFCACWRTESVN